MASPTPYAALADTSVAFVPPEVGGLSDDALLADKRLLAEIRRRVDAADAVISAELAHRSRPELGGDGLAQRLGARTPEKLIQHLTGVSARDARTQVQVGSMLGSRPDSDPGPVWLRDVAAAVAAGRITLQAAEVIRSGLGAPSEAVTADALADAARQLVRLAGELTVEKLAVRAREVRAALDHEFVVDRQAAIRARRYLRLIRQADGSTRIDGLLDLEDGPEVQSILDAVTSPRLGGPRFVDPAEAAEADAARDDERTPEQLVLDTFVQLLRLGAQADEATFVGARRPAAQIVVTLADLRSGTGAAFFEGTGEPVSVATAARHICDSGSVPILFGEKGEVLDIGRELRLFNRRQRIGLAARDGGCVWPGCDRPPSWCEAHHIVEWRAGGRTDVADGVLLCRHHHLLLHNNGWRIERSGAEYALVPPSSIDPRRRPVPVVTKSAVRRRALDATAPRGQGSGEVAAAATGAA